MIPESIFNQITTDSGIWLQVPNIGLKLPHINSLGIQILKSPKKQIVKLKPVSVNSICVAPCVQIVCFLVYVLVMFTDECSWPTS